MHYFLQIFGTLPRAGPGSDEHTRQALAMIEALPKSPRILDIGCGPGKQSLELLRTTSCTLVALDLFPEMIARLQSAAAEAGVADRLQTLQVDMKQMDFPSYSFDVIWSEGAIYILGFENGLRRVMEYVKPGGYVVVSEAVWLKPNPPGVVREFWQGYPEIDTVASKLEVIRQLGYESIGHFLLPPKAWNEEYYEPMEIRIAEKEMVWENIPEAAAVLAEAKKEIAIYRRYSDYFSYAFFVMRKPIQSTPAN